MVVADCFVDFFFLQYNSFPPVESSSVLDERNSRSMSLLTKSLQLDVARSGRRRGRACVVFRNPPARWTDQSAIPLGGRALPETTRPEVEEKRIPGPMNSALLVSVICKVLYFNVCTFLFLSFRFIL